MNNDMHTMARILAAIRANEGNLVFNTSLVDEKIIKADAKTRDWIALQLQKEGYIEGLFVIDDIDNMERPYIMWDASTPHLTIKGIEFINENQPLRKAMKEIKDVGVAVASQTLSNTINNLCR